MSHLHHIDSGTYVLDLRWAVPPLTLNQRLHKQVKAKVTRQVRDKARTLAANLGMPVMDRPCVQLVWLVTSRHRRDADNVVPTLKALADGLVDAGVARDDTPEFMEKPMPVIAYARGHHKAPGMFLVVWDAEARPTAELRALAELDVEVEL
ncbi:hypothetical protein IT882_12970 [Microbacterium schleiferi]|uniref:Uncharacterized protein n=1 Tax=Microbacterium schleiferi TaxID=69362 RepID=A0A7S8MX17_9MICO|nr:hypothetical protein [Microbacterium schleiferi]QPE04105.1 hypothetical protein IT882_12970 [Microbacterium schleiferi]